MLVIRLARHGRKNWPTYRLVLQEKDWAPMSKAIETLGTMDPHTNPTTIVLKTERISYWLGKGAQPSTTVHNLLLNAGLIKGEKQRSVTGATPAKFVVATPVVAPVEATVEAAPVEPAAPVAA
ncbi:MAG: 30S ribosomal protein S16 [Candidatus Kerfeldbacteria bacterium]|nr:30S ribosomal protein S16 [Candidatus Kerfeldbacteria bacterium]